MAKISINQDALKPKREWKRHKVKEGSNPYRFLPPFGEGSNGYPYRKWMVIWGLCDPESGRMRPYASSITTSEKRCPVMEYVDELRKVVETKKSKLQASGLSDKEIKEQLKPLNRIIGDLRPKTIYAWNAVDKAGTLGILEVKPTAQKQIKDLMRSYIKDYNQDPTSINSDDDDSGVWFDIKRTGTGFDTEYTVVKVQMMTKINGQPTYVDDRGALPDHIRENWEDEAYDLSAIYQIKTYAELREVLDANLKDIVDACPEAALNRFDSPALVADTSTDTTSVGINLDDDEDEVKEVVSKTDLVSGDAPAQTTTTKDDDDIFAMADSILND
jgi:hypothetical protein